MTAHACLQPQITIKPAKEEKPKPQKIEMISKDELTEKVVSGSLLPCLSELYMVVMIGLGARISFIKK